MHTGACLLPSPNSRQWVSLLSLPTTHIWRWEREREGSHESKESLKQTKQQHKAFWSLELTHCVSPIFFFVSFEFRATYLWHMMLGVSAVMYSGTFYARVCKLNASSQYQSKDRFNISNRSIYSVVFRWRSSSEERAKESRHAWILRKARRRWSSLKQNHSFRKAHILRFKQLMLVV